MYRRSPEAGLNHHFYVRTSVCPLTFLAGPMRRRSLKFDMVGDDIS